MIKYSLLTSNPSVYTDLSKMLSLLSQGIKILVFGPQHSISQLRSESFSPYQNIRLLQVFTVEDSLPLLTIEDGCVDKRQESLLNILASKAPAFNFEQYQIEHAPASSNLIIEAGAGTGKTTVMIDRILFLLHTVPDLLLEHIGMITFTNEATQNMKHKIQSALMSRYLVTHSPKYLQFLEGSAKIQIQTIHSFSRDIINELGSSIGYANTIGLKGFKYQKKQIIHDVLNKQFIEKQTAVNNSLGAKLHELDKLLLDFWTKLEDIGLSDEEISALDWGYCSDTSSAALHATLSSSFPELICRYNDLKMTEDAIAVGDIVRELRRILDTGMSLEIKRKKLKYLFVDEFQDSDNAQIQTIAWLQKNTGLILFAVGDVKQSIYRFRGAVETAFEKLRVQLQKNGAPKPSEFTLIRNYRTSCDILHDLDPIFRNLESQNLLLYGQSLEAQRTHTGSFHCSHIRNSRAVYSQETVRVLRELLHDCTENAARNTEKQESVPHVTVLTRTNYQLSEIGAWCRESHIPCYIRQEGTFYSSPAVRDFACLVSALLFPKSSVHLFDYINSSYCSVDYSLEALHAFKPASAVQIGFLTDLLSNQGWNDQLKKLRLKPVLSVLMEAVDNQKPARRYIEKRRQQLQEGDGWNEESAMQQLTIEAKQYEADLEKLLVILQDNFSGQIISLYQIYNFLQVQISTNKVEDEPDISEEMGSECVYGMTVHKAKGLEFDTVFLPLTQREFRKEIETELLLDEESTPPKVGWSRVEYGKGQSGPVIHQHNDYYAQCLQKEIQDVDREEARLLYVALTRSIRRLECFIIGSKPHSWASMLEV